MKGFLQKLDLYSGIINLGGECMGKMRVYEYAKQSNTTSKEVIDHLKELKVDISNHMSTIDQETVRTLDKKFNPTEHVQEDETPAEAPVAEKVSENEITYSGSLTVEGLAEKLKVNTKDVIKKLISVGVMVTKNQDIDEDTIEYLASEYGKVMKKEEVLEDTNLDKYKTAEKEKDLIERPAVVTIMGHVDHGKTTLLDSIRDTKVTEGEAGGITQHIGAYQAESEGKKITFLDTPGHEAFTSMRSRGAQVTDVATLVVAADDGVMPQTVEAINHAKAAEVPIIVAVNKMDKESANPDRVMQELTEYELLAEDWGGDTIFVNISAIKREGIDDLLEMILLVAEVEELKANANNNAFGTVIDAQLVKGLDAVARLLAKYVAVYVGDPFVIAHTVGRVRAIFSDAGERVTEAGRSTRIEISGLHVVAQ